MSSQTMDLSIERIETAFFSPNKDQDVCTLMKEFMGQTFASFNTVKQSLQAIQDSNEVWKQQVVEKITSVEERIQANENQISELNHLVGQQIVAKVVSIEDKVIANDNQVSNIKNLVTALADRVKKLEDAPAPVQAPALAHTPAQGNRNFRPEG